jgi:hypothetical protein
LIGSYVQVIEKVLLPVPFGQPQLAEQVEVTLEHGLSEHADGEIDQEILRFGKLLYELPEDLVGERNIVNATIGEQLLGRRIEILPVLALEQVVGDIFLWEPIVRGQLPQPLLQMVPQHLASHREGIEPVPGLDPIVVR